MQSEYLPYSVIKKRYGVSRDFLIQHEKKEKIDTIHMPGGKRLYSLQHVETILNIKQTPKEKNQIIYARVSSHHQQSDLKRQIDFLQHHYPGAKILSDIGSGINFKRHGFQTLLEWIHKGIVSDVIVLWKDRLCRFGFEFVEWLCEKHQVRILVHNDHFQETNSKQSDTQELADDLLSIVNVFVARRNGIRSAINRKQRAKDALEQKTKKITETDQDTSSSRNIRTKRQRDEQHQHQDEKEQEKEEEEEEERNILSNEKDSIVSHKRRKTSHSEMDGSSSLDI